MSALQPGMLGNGLFSKWMTRLSNFSGLTAIAINARSPGEFADALFLRFLTRLPSEAERDQAVDLLAPGFETRVIGPSATFEKALFVHPLREVSWAYHLDPASNVLAAEIEAEAEQGPPPAGMLDADWRERAEDLIWALINQPELQFTP